MDVTPVIYQLPSALWYTVSMLVIIWIIKSSWLKGIAGEFFINTLIKFRLPKDQYHLIKNVTLPTEDGTTQIDHIIVSRYGLFVVETKNMKGWIFGKPNQQQWTQQIYKHRYRFQNPIHQNYKHIKTLETLLNINDESIFSVIVFVGDSTFKTPVPDNVTHAGGCIQYIKAHQEAVFTDEQVSNIVDGIESGRLERGLKTNREHVAHVKQLVEQQANEKRCTKCGAPMTLRESKLGQHAGKMFWGCSTFPKCRNVVDC